MGRGLFITLEGVEGSGKTTHAATLAGALTRQSRTVTLTHEPGGTGAGEVIRKIFLDPTVELDVVTELLLVLADRAQHVRETIRPAVKAGAIVISDRYSDSTTAYQGYGRGLDLALLGELNRLATGGMAPDLTIVLDCSVETGLARTRERMKGKAHRFDRFETERVEFHRRVREGFLAIAASEPERVRLVASERPREAVDADVLSAVEELMKRRCL
jgi:dTMP kinase